jgi:anti-sigma regulatory factor (Ser/Thr protein kinase)
MLHASTRPPRRGQGGHFRSYAKSFAAAATAPSRARAFTDEVLDSWAAPAECRDDVRLIVSELVANAVRGSHGVRVAIRRLPTRIRIEIRDGLSGVPSPLNPGPDAENGRGLLLVERLSAGWGVTARRSGGKTVWCEVSTDRSAPSRPTPAR